MEKWIRENKIVSILGPYYAPEIYINFFKQVLCWWWWREICFGESIPKQENMDFHFSSSLHTLPFNVLFFSFGFSIRPQKNRGRRNNNWFVLEEEEKNIFLVLMVDAAAALFVCQEKSILEGGRKRKKYCQLMYCEWMWIYILFVYAHFKYTIYIIEMHLSLFPGEMQLCFKIYVCLVLRVERFFR